MIEIFHFENDKLLKTDISGYHKIKDKLVWVDVTAITKEEEKQLQTEFGLHPLTSEDLYNKSTRIKVEEFPEYLFCIFYGIEKKKRVELTELDFVVGDKFVISNHQDKIKSFEELKENSRLSDIIKKGPDFLFHKLIDMEVDNYFPILDTIDSEIEKIEEGITQNPRPELLDSILRIKRRITRIKKYALPQREKLGFLTKSDYKHISKKSIPYFRDVYDHAVRVADSVDNYREAISNTFDVYMSAVSNRMNEVMKVLSIIATIALPLTVISGIYGTNFSVLPGAAQTYGFWIMIGAMAAMGISMIIFFKRRGWF